MLDHTSSIGNRLCSARIRAVLSIAVLAACLVLAWIMPAHSYADEADGSTDAGAVVSKEPASANEASIEREGVEVSADGDSARIEGSNYAVSGFYRMQVGSNRDINGQYHGYCYLLNQESSLIVLNTKDYALVYVSEAYKQEYSIDFDDEDDIQLLKDYLITLDEGFAKGIARLSNRDVWYFTGNETFEHDGIMVSFNQEYNEGRFYVSIIGSHGQDVKDAVDPQNLDSCELVPYSQATIVDKGNVFQQMANFLSTVNLNPLWITLKTTGVAIIFIFILGLAAAYFTLHLSNRAKNIFDSIFTIPMVLPPTVCGFLLLMLLGKNTFIGRWFIDIGFPLIFSWQATVIAAVVVAFPLMYRSARGAFENLDERMLDAARTLGWSNAKIFFRLMLPLAWSSIAAGTVLSFARALGEFGATLFLAGNQLSSTRTIPIAIYFEWMNGNEAATWFWTILLIIFSFIVILFINIWSSHTTRYRRQDVRDEE